MPKILMADDHGPTRGMLRRILGEAKYQIIEACNGEEAYARALDQRPDLILLDGMMPRMDGYEALNLLKSNVTTASIPVVMLTALDLPRERKLALDMGAADYIIKPVLLDELWSILRRLLGEPAAARCA